MLKSYIKKIAEIANCGDAREESYYSSLEWLLTEFAQTTNKNNQKVITLPKKTEAGNPDFRIWDSKQHIVGYIEAKAPTIDDLSQVENSEQLKRYRDTFPNLILTNFLEFRLYRNGILQHKVAIARPFIIHKLQAVPPVEQETEFFNLLEAFFSFSLPKVYDSRSLAVELAKRTRFLKDEVVTEELREKTKGHGFILSFYEAFQQYLISGLTKIDFANLYSQTITYGLFAARTRAKDGFNRKLAYDNIPRTIGILRELFKFISLGDLPPQMEWIVDDIAEVLAVTDVTNLLLQYYREGKGRDPIIHFYETFLSEYDPKTREKRGVYYTPEPVVCYIVRSINLLLKERFNKSDGLANDSVTVLDPAAGTLTFMAEATQLATEEFISRYGEGGKENFIKEHILNNFYAFELMMAPYAIGHIKMSFLLEELGYQLQKDERFKLYLTNTLEMEDLAQTELPGMASLSQESRLAGKIKKEQPILVILGNPPYSGHSANQGKWIDDLLKKGYSNKNGIKNGGYYQVDGKALGEKNPKWLQDDYVKFIRFAQWKIDQAGEGVLGFITNHSYLDNPTFRGMRQSLLDSFDELYFLDLHGNVLKKEKCPDGSKDENVFDIRQGAAIAIFVKTKDNSAKTKVHHAEIYGKREKKYDWLLNHDVRTTQWKKLIPKSQFYFYVPRDEKFQKIYHKFPQITDIFPLHGVGMTTARDQFVIDRDKQALLNRIRLFKNSKYSDDDLHRFFQINKKKGWDIRTAWDSLQSITDSELKQFIQPIMYRPFDIQWIFYHDAVVWRTVKQVMKHLMHENLGLIVPRQVVKDFRHAFCTNCMTNFNSLDVAGRFGSGYLFPLYHYPENNNDSNKSNRSAGTLMMVFDVTEPYRSRRANIDRSFLETLANSYGKFSYAEDIFFYIYAILYSDIYRTKYAELLRIDFPRIPFTTSYDIFKKLGEFGKRLVDLHLLQSAELDPPLAKFQGKGNNKVAGVTYDEKRGTIQINPDQYFENINKNIWQYQIGGYKICHKWLKDRKDKILSLDEIKLYCKIVAALNRTIAMQQEIDSLYTEIEQKIIEF
ncbi:N-6 DNA methylase [candidate division KSB1 bacterium]|nr:N-6 DNA methylase [candidate division KSB1 bacterium]